HHARGLVTVDIPPSVFPLSLVTIIVRCQHRRAGWHTIAQYVRKSAPRGHGSRAIRSPDAGGGLAAAAIGDGRARGRAGRVRRVRADLPPSTGRYPGAVDSHR